MTSSCSPFLDTILSEQWAMSMSLIRKTVCRRHGSWRWRGVGAEIVQSYPSRAPERRTHYSIQSQCTHLMINDDHHHVIIIIIIIGYPGCSFSSSLNSEMVGYMFSLLIISAYKIPSEPFSPLYTIPWRFEEGVFNDIVQIFLQIFNRISSFHFYTFM